MNFLMCPCTYPYHVTRPSFQKQLLELFGSLIVSRFKTETKCIIGDPLQDLNRAQNFQNFSQRLVDSFRDQPAKSRLNPSKNSGGVLWWGRFQPETGLKSLGPCFYSFLPGFLLSISICKFKYMILQVFLISPKLRFLSQTIYRQPSS